MDPWTQSPPRGPVLSVFAADTRLQSQPWFPFSAGFLFRLWKASGLFFALTIPCRNIQRTVIWVCNFLLGSVCQIAVNQGTKWTLSSEAILSSLHTFVVLCQGGLTVTQTSRVTRLPAVLLSLPNELRRWGLGPLTPSFLGPRRGCWNCRKDSNRLRGCEVPLVGNTTETEGGNSVKWKRTQITPNTVLKSLPRRCSALGADSRVT